MLARLASMSGLTMMLAACGGAPAAPAPVPTAPAPVPAAANRAPSILDASLTPTLGVAQLTTFHARVQAADPDGDPVSVTWSSWNVPLGDQSELAFTPCGCRGPSPLISSPLDVAVSDGKGGRVTAKLDFIVAGLTGSFDGYYDDGSGPLFIMDLTQTGSAATGTFYDVRREHRGTTDPADPGRIEADGHFTLRFKLPSEPDFVLTGQFEPNKTGRFLSAYIGKGRVIGGVYDGRTFIFGIHDSY